MRVVAIKDHLQDVNRWAQNFKFCGALISMCDYSSGSALAQAVSLAIHFLMLDARFGSHVNQAAAVNHLACFAERDIGWNIIAKAMFVFE